MKIKVACALALALIAFSMSLLAFQQSQPAETTKIEERQVPPAPQETKGIYVPGVTPFLWEHHGANPYIPGGVPTRESLIEMSKKLSLISDLRAQGFTIDQANAVKQALADANNPQAVAEIEMTLDTGCRNMRFATGVVPMVILKGKAEPAWQIILPKELGSLVVWIPKVCGNVCLSVFPAQHEVVTFQTEVKEREAPAPKPEIKVVEKEVQVPVESEKVKVVPQVKEIPIEHERVRIVERRIEVPVGGKGWWDRNWWKVLVPALAAGGVLAYLSLRDKDKGIDYKINPPGRSSPLAIQPAPLIGAGFSFRF